MQRFLKPRLHLALASLFLVNPTVASAADDEHIANAAFFRESVWPVIENRCLRCHGENPEKLRGAFRMDSRESILAGGDRGPAIDEARLEDSLLLDMISWKDADHEMPPNKQLTGGLPYIACVGTTRAI